MSRTQTKRFRNERLANAAGRTLEDAGRLASYAKENVFHLNVPYPERLPTKGAPPCFGTTIFYIFLMVQHPNWEFRQIQTTEREIRNLDDATYNKIAIKAVAMMLLMYRYPSTWETKWHTRSARQARQEGPPPSPLDFSLPEPVIPLPLPSVVSQTAPMDIPLFHNEVIVPHTPDIRENLLVDADGNIDSAFGRAIAPSTPMDETQFQMDFDKPLVISESSESENDDLLKPGAKRSLPLPPSSTPKDPCSHSPPTRAPVVPKRSRRAGTTPAFRTGATPDFRTNCNRLEKLWKEIHDLKATELKMTTALLANRIRQKELQVSGCQITKDLSHAFDTEYTNEGKGKGKGKGATSSTLFDRAMNHEGGC